MSVNKWNLSQSNHGSDNSKRRKKNAGLLKAINANVPRKNSKNKRYPAVTREL